MQTQSIWNGTSKPGRFPALDGDLTVDVAILGAGITGLTAASVLAGHGLSVAVLEARTVGFGTTGNSTGNLYETTEAGLRSISQSWGAEAAGRVAESRRGAVRFIEETARKHGMDCAFGRRPLIQGALSGHAGLVEEVEAEYEALRHVGATVRWLDEVPLPLKVEKAFALEGQAQFHPLEYVRRLAEAIASPACRIFERSPATEIDRDDGAIEVGPHTVTASHVLLATHIPKGFNLVQTEAFPYREYGIAAKLKGAFPHGIYWTYGPSKFSVRFLDSRADRFVIVVGGHHKVGHGDPTESLASCERFLRAHFPVEEPAYRWSAQGYRPADGLPMIGPSPNGERTWIATGFATDGLTYGTLAGQILGDWIAKGSSPWGDLYRSTRFTPVKSAKEFLIENLDVAGQFVKDYVAGHKAKSLDDVKPGHGKIVEVEGRALAVHRRGNGRLTAVSPVCTHLKCKVHWNDVERTWDCPCHGSRFEPDGSVLEGPAIEPLEKRDVGGG